MFRKNGYIIEHCQLNCSQAAISWEPIKELLESTLNALDLGKVLNSKFDPLRNYHIPKISLAGCPNGCSQPLIKDFGISGYVNPKLTDVPCVACRTCERACLEKAITFANGKVSIDSSLCLACGGCLQVCPTGTLSTGESGWKLYLGGRVGRHPHFAVLVGKTKDKREVVDWIIKNINDYICHCLPQEKMSYFLERFELNSNLANEVILSLEET